MTRREFSKQTKRDAHDRANGHCEAVGEFYGLDPGQRCNMPLTRGREYDHIILAANGGDISLSNCACVCIPCHRFKTAKHDIPVAAKTLRQQDKDRNIRPASTFPRRIDPWGKERRV